MASLINNYFELDLSAKQMSKLETKLARIEDILYGVIIMVFGVSLLCLSALIA